MVDRAEQIKKELNLLYQQESQIAQQIQDLLVERAQLQSDDMLLLQKARFKSLHGTGRR